MLVLAGILFLDPANVGCEECPDNAFLVHESQTAFDVIEVVTSLLGLVLVAEVARTLLRRWREAAPRRRRAMAPVLAAGGLVSLAFGAGFVFDVAGLDDVATAFDLLALLGVIAVPWCFLVGLARTALTRGGAVGDLVARLRGALGPDTVRGSLAAALGDDSLQLAYWLPERERYVDAAGHDLPEELEAGRTATPVELEGRRVGALVHDARLLEEPELVRAVADAAALAFERERLDAELRYTVEQLAASRARIVEAGDAERRRLERNLHDGAQQRLVSLSLSLRLAQAKLATDAHAADELLSGASVRARSCAGGASRARARHPPGRSHRTWPRARTRVAGRPCAGARGARAASDRASARSCRGSRVLRRLRGARQRRQVRGGTSVRVSVRAGDGRCSWRWPTTARVAPIPGGVGPARARRPRRSARRSPGWSKARPAPVRARRDPARLRPPPWTSPRVE